MKEARDRLNVIRDFASILYEHRSVLDAEEVAQGAQAIEEQAELALESLDEAEEDEAVSPPATRAQVSYGLSTREKEVLRLVANGLADKQIAARLSVSTYTVSKHVGSILAKMNAASRTEAGVRALREGILE